VEFKERVIFSCINTGYKDDLANKFTLCVHTVSHTLVHVRTHSQYVKKLMECLFKVGFHAYKLKHTSHADILLQPILILLAGSHMTQIQLTWHTCRSHDTHAGHMTHMQLTNVAPPDLEGNIQVGLSLYTVR